MPGGAPATGRPSPLDSGSMEVDGHPTQDLIDELERRGAQPLRGSSSGPRVDALRFLTEREGGDTPGLWLFLPSQAFDTEIDEIPQ